MSTSCSGIRIEKTFRSDTRCDEMYVSSIASAATLLLQKKGVNRISEKNEK